MLDLKNKSILITGGTGSFGKNFVKYLLNSEAKRIIIFSRDELKQYKIQKELQDNRLRFFIGDVRDLKRLQMAFRDIDIIVHAAALKQVPALEYNPFEAIKTNVLGTQNVLDACINQGVQKAILISTDKAVEPINLYGASKLCAEKLFIAGNSYSGVKCKFSVVRYGNVIGSRGSIIETLLEKRAEEKVNITDERMTRFWLTLEESIKLVLFAIEKLEGGEIFVPKVPSMKLVDIFQALAPECKRQITGIRPGEKLHEILLTKQEIGHTLEFDNYYVILPQFLNQQKYIKYFENGQKINDDFKYTSDKNKNWLTSEQFLKTIVMHKI